MADSNNIELARAYVTIVPSMQGAQQTITSELTGAAEPAGAEAGEAIGSSMISSLEEALGEVGKTLTATVTAPIMAAAAASVAAWRSVDEGLDVVTAKTGATGEELEALHSMVFDIADTMPVAFDDVGAAVGELNTRFGLTGEELDDLSRQFLMFARVNGVEVSTTIDNVQRAMAALNVDVDDASDFLDTMNAVGQQTGIDMNTLANEIVANASVLNDLGMSAADAAFFVGTLDKSGIDSATALTALRRAMINAAEEGLTTSDAIAQLQETIENTDDRTEALLATQELFGRAAPQMLNALQNGSISFDVLNRAVSDFGGSVDATYNEVVGPMDELTTVFNRLKELGYELVDAFGPTISALIDSAIPAIESLTDAWNSLDPQMQEAILRLALIAAAVGPVLVAGSKLIGSIQTIGSALPRLGTHLANLGSNAANAAAGATSATASFSSMAGTALMLVALGAAIWMVAEGMSVMASAAISLAEAGPAAIAVFFGMIGAATAMSAVILLVGASASASAVGLLALGAAILMITGGIALITEACAHLVSEINGLVQTIIAGSTQINSIIRTLAQSIQQIIITVVAGIITVIDNLGRTIDRTVTNLARNVQNVIRTTGNSITQIVNSIGGNISRVLDSVAGVIDSVGTSAVNTGRGFDTFTSAVQRLVNMNLLDLVATFGAVSRGLDSIVNSARGIPDAAASIRDLSRAFATTRFNFNPGHIALPHFTMTGNFNAQSRSVPTVRVQWYAAAAEQGARFTRPQIIGVGDAKQPEILLGEDKLKELVGGRPINITINGAEGQNVNELAEAVALRLEREVRRNKAVFA